MNIFPNNKKFAFSIFDDTDLSTVENTAPIYRLLSELGMRTTKSVWPLASVSEGKFGGCSLQDEAYRDFILDLRDAGFEVALHGMRNHHSSRALIEEGFAEFQRLIGHDARIYANHSSNRDNLYWGARRFRLLRPFYAVASFFSGKRGFEGHISGSEFFWGDLCRERLDYVRDFVFHEINLDCVNSTMPYHDNAKPFVKYWFSSCDGADVDSFCELLSEPNQERLERERGVCIVYTHFACGFVEGGRVRPRVERILRALAQRDGWFAPVSQVLDHLRAQRQPGSIPIPEFINMECRWACERIGTTLKRCFVRRKQSSRDPLLSIRQIRKQSNKTRIVHITSAHSALDTRIFYKECRSLAQAGYEVILLGSHALNESRDGVTFRGLGKSRGRVHRVTLTLMALCREAFQLKADLYHIHDPELLVVALLLRASGRRVVYDIHEDLPRTFPYKKYLHRPIRSLLSRLIEPLENIAARCMSGLVTATPTINKRFSAFNSRSVVVNNFPLQDALSQPSNFDWNQRTNSVAYVGGISEERGIREMLSAMDLVPQHLNVKLELAGPLSPGLYGELATGAPWRHVIWNKTLDRAGVSSLLARVRVGLVVTHPEPNLVVSQPVKLFEYMAAGIPVIASDFPLWRAMVEEFQCCLFVDPWDPQEIARAIEQMLSNPAQAEAMGKRGREAVEERFRWSVEEKTLLSFYSNLLDNAQAPVFEASTIQPSQETQ